MSQQVHDMFSGIASTYDVTNSVLSMGIHHLWRAKTIKLSGAKTSDQILDCATGTGDLAMGFKKVVGAEGKVIGTDFCKDMLDLAVKKSQRQKMDIVWQVEDAMNLSFADNSFDIASIAFGIRNVDDPKTCLVEMARVIKPGGKVVILEFGQPRWPIRPFFRFYSNVVLPKIGGWISGDQKAYHYLNRTSASFPCGKNFLALMENTGVFKKCTFYSLTFGISYLYVGEVD